MKENIEIQELAKILVETFYNRMISHSVLRDYEKEAIEKGVSENTGHKGFYDVRLDNVADWGFAEAVRVWRKLEKQLEAEYKIEIYHEKKIYRSGFYTWQRDKVIKFNNGSLKIILGSKMMEPRYPKEVGNTVYFTVNSKELYDEIWKEFNRVKNAINDKNHTVKIGDIAYSTEKIAKSIKNKPKVIINLFEDVLKTINTEDDYFKSIKPVTKIVLGKFVEYYDKDDDSVTGHLAKALYTKVGGEGWDW